MPNMCQAHYQCQRQGKDKMKTLYSQNSHSSDYVPQTL